MTTLAFSINVYTRELVQIYSDPSKHEKDKLNQKLIDFTHQILLSGDPNYLTLSLQTKIQDTAHFYKKN